MGLFFRVTDTLSSDNGAIAVLETIDRRGTNTATGITAGNDHRIDPSLNEIGHHRGLEKDRRSALAHDDIVIWIINPGVQLSTGMAMTKLLDDGGNFPIRRITLAGVGRVATGNRDVVAACHGEQAGRVLQGP